MLFEKDEEFGASATAEIETLLISIGIHVAALSIFLALNPESADIDAGSESFKVMGQDYDLSKQEVDRSWSCLSGLRCARGRTASSADKAPSFNHLFRSEPPPPPPPQRQPPATSRKLRRR